MSIVKVRLVLLCSVLLLQHGIVQAQHSDTVALPEIEISASRYDVPAARMQQQASVLTPAQVEERQAVTPKDMAALVPGLVMPDYGSAMTSSIYIRGLGSRIDNPVIGFVIDGVPLLDKNMYDQHLPDIRRMTFLRGPQGTLYGRNTMGGLLEISTLQPLDMGSLLVRAHAAYSTANTVDATAAVYHPVSDKWGWALGASFGRTDGFHTNTFSGNFATTMLSMMLAICGLAGLLTSLNLPRVPGICYIGEHSMVYFISHYPMLYYYKFMHLSFGRSIWNKPDDVLILVPVIFGLCTWMVPFVERVPWLSGRRKNLTPDPSPRRGEKNGNGK